MRVKLQFAAGVLALGLGGAFALPSVAQRPHYAAQKPAAPAPHPRAAARPAQRQQQRQEQRQQARQQQRQQNGANGGQNGADRGQTDPEWNRPAGGTARDDRPPSANTPAKRFNNLPPQDKQRLLDNNRKFQNLSPAQRQDLQDRAHVWQQMTPAQREHIKNDVLPKWQSMPQDRRRAIQQRLGVLKNMPESARNQHLNDPNFTRGMSDEDRSTLRDLSHLHVGGAPDPPNE
jgi:hypothetical protein